MMKKHSLSKKKRSIRGGYVENIPKEQRLTGKELIEQAFNTTLNE